MTPISRFLESMLPLKYVPLALICVYSILLASILIGLRVDDVTIQYIQQL